jgi:hypothetical protein
MAWNKYYIFVKSPKLTDINEIISKLNLGQYKPAKEVPLHFSNKPETLFAGFYNGNLLIVHPDIPFHFFNDTQSNTEKLFNETFPDSEIAALVENSTVGLFSYAIIDKGQKVRMKDGSDGEIYHDIGELLGEEKEVLAEKIFGDDELEEMNENGLTEDEVNATIKFEASWRVPNRLTKRYLGETVNSIDTNKVILTMYE